jgi:large subunit ribosomal protein L9
MARKKIKKDKNIPILLLEDIAQVGNRGEVKKVSRGFALYLFRKGQAIIVTPENKDQLDKLIKVSEEKLIKKQKELEELKEKIEKLVFKTYIKVGPHGEVYSSINKMHIKKFLEEHNIFVTKEDIALNEPIKIAGEHIVEINLGLNIKANLKVIVEEKK